MSQHVYICTSTWSCTSCNAIGEEDCKLFEEFVVSKEDLQITGSCDSQAQRALSRDSIANEHQSPANLGSPCVSTSSPDSLATSGSCKQLQTPNHILPELCQQTSDTASAPPLSPSIDGSNGSPTIASSFTFAGVCPQLPLVTALDVRLGTHVH